MAQCEAWMDRFKTQWRREQLALPILLLTREIDGHLLPGYQAYQNQYVRYIYRCDT